MRVERLLDSVGDLDAPAPIDAMRGTNFVAGLRWLREHGHDARYFEGLTPAARSMLVAPDASAWVPLDIALIHYRALDALGLTFEERIELGASASRQLNGVVLSTIARLAGSAGLSPLVPLSRAAKLFARNFRGGAVGVFQTAPTEARFEVRGAPMAVSACHRDNLCGALLDGARPFARDPKVTELPGTTATSYAFRMRW